MFACGEALLHPGEHSNRGCADRGTGGIKTKHRIGKHAILRIIYAYHRCGDIWLLDIRELSRDLNPYGTACVLATSDSGWSKRRRRSTKMYICTLGLDIRALQQQVFCGHFVGMG